MSLASSPLSPELTLHIKELKFSTCVLWMTNTTIKKWRKFTLESMHMLKVQRDFLSHIQSNTDDLTWLSYVYCRRSTRRTLIVSSCYLQYDLFRAFERAPFHNIPSSSMIPLVLSRPGWPSWRLQVHGSGLPNPAKTIEIFRSSQWF